ncbi:MAG TPA: glycine cleavage T C-terminal barrel domain-containing protein, partial [Aggregatilineaceae bacterium]|nr:glycine cleavage T C-terminal barrel domain-containing protein [Aggregatilineaceae bacterium]
STAKYLQSRIFFMDRVTVQHRSADFAQFQFFGPTAPDVLRTLRIADPPGPDALIAVDVDGIPIRVLGPHPAVSLGYHLIVPADQADSFSARLSDVAPLSPELYDLLRIEAGLPVSGHELTDDFTPLEANLDAAISDHKGCYTGQEVIARQVNYDKITRRLVGLRLDHPVSLGSSVQVEGRTVGQVTSAAESPRWGAVALAVIRRPHHEPGTPVTVAGDSPVSGTVAALPF